MDTALGSAKYIGSANAHTTQNWWRRALDRRIMFKGACSGNSDDASSAIKNIYVAVSSTKAIGINVSVGTSGTANSDMFDSVTYTHVPGVSITEAGSDVGQVRLQGTGSVGTHGGWSLCAARRSWILATFWHRLCSSKYGFTSWARPVYI